MQRLKPQNVLRKWQKLTKTQRQLTITKQKSLSDKSNASQSEIANRKIASLQTLVDCIGDNDQLHDLHHTISVPVTEFNLLISEYLGNRIVSDVKQSLCWASIVYETTNTAALRCPFHVPQPDQRENFQVCAALKPSKESGYLM